MHAPNMRGVAVTQIWRGVVYSSFTTYIRFTKHRESEMVRYKNRYLLIKWNFQDVLKGQRELEASGIKGVTALLREAMLTSFGDFGLASVQSSLSVKYLNVATLTMMVRCPRAHSVAVRTALSLMSCCHGESCSLSVVHIAGSMRSTQTALFKSNKKMLTKIKYM